MKEIDIKYQKCFYFGELVIFILIFYQTKKSYEQGLIYEISYKTFE